MRKLIILFTLTILPCVAVTKTVCNPGGCDFSTFQAALDAATGVGTTAPDCTITTLLLTHGQTFSAASHYLVRGRVGCGTTLLTIETDNFSLLPPLGMRAAVATDLANMATITTTNVNDNVVQFGALEIVLTGVNTTTHFISLSSDSDTIAQVAVGVPLSFRDGPNFGIGPTQSPQPGLPTPLARFTKYYVTAVQNRASSTIDVTVSLTLGGSTVAVSDSNGINSPSTNYYWQPIASLYNSAHQITLRGLNIVVPDPGPNADYQNVAVLVGVSESMLESQVSDIQFEQCFIWLGNSAFRNRGLVTAIELECNNCGFNDGFNQSLSFTFGESHGLSSRSGRNLTYNNNRIEALGARLFTGGAVPIIPLQNVTNLTALGNYFVTPGWMMYSDSAQLGSTTPRSPGYYQEGSGAFFLNKTGSPTDCSGGACLEVQSDGTWAVNTSAVFRSIPNHPKAAVEFKECVNCEVGNTIIRGNVVGPDTGNTGTIGLVLTEQTQFDANGTAYYTHSGINLHDIWADRVFSGILVGQTGAPIGQTPAPITSITANDINSFHILTSSPSTHFGGCNCPFFTGISGTGNTTQLNGRFSYPLTQPDNMTLNSRTHTEGAQFDASGTASSGTVLSTTWPVNGSETVNNVLITRIGELALTPFQPYPSGATSRPFRMFLSSPVGPVVKNLTIRACANCQPTNGAIFETPMYDSFAGAPYAAAPSNGAILQDSIFSAFNFGSGEGTGIAANCSNTGYGGFFANGAAFSHLLMSGPAAFWRTLSSTCADNSTQLTAATDTAVGYANSDQSVLLNSCLASTSPYSAQNGSPTMLSRNGTDLGVDCQALDQVLHNVVAGTPAWTTFLSLGNTTTSVTATMAAPYNADTWALTLYNAPARIAGNQVSTGSGTGAVTLGSLTPGTLYYYKMADSTTGTQILVGSFTTGSTVNGGTLTSGRDVVGGKVVIH